MLTISLKIRSYFYPLLFHDLCKLQFTFANTPPFTAKCPFSRRSKENAEIYFPHINKQSYTSHRPTSFIGHWGHKLCATKQNFTTILVYKCAFFVTTISHTVLLFTRLGHHAFALLLSTFPKFLI